MGHTVHAVGSRPGPWIGLASACWAANAALGASVGAGIVRTGRFRWIHHALYIATTTTTVDDGPPLKAALPELIDDALRLLTRALGNCFAVPSGARVVGRDTAIPASTILRAIQECVGRDPECVCNAN